MRCRDSSMIVCLPEASLLAMFSCYCKAPRHAFSQTHWWIQWPHTSLIGHPFSVLLELNYKVGWSAHLICHLVSIWSSGRMQVSFLCCDGDLQSTLTGKSCLQIGRERGVLPLPGRQTETVIIPLRNTNPSPTPQVGHWWLHLLEQRKNKAYMEEGESYMRTWTLLRKCGWIGETCLGKTSLTGKSTPLLRVLLLIYFTTADSWV